MAGRPNTSKIFAVFEPTTFPNARLGTSSITALMAMISSGAEVPKATTVRLTIRAGMPKRILRLTAPLTSASPARIRSANPRAADSQTTGQPLPLPQAQGPVPILKRPQDEQRAASSRFLPGNFNLPNIASTPMPTRNRTTIFRIIL